MERLFFPFFTYTDPVQSLFPKKIKTGFIYTMNVTEEEMKKRSYGRHLGIGETVMETLFGTSEALFSFDTYQFNDYSKMVAGRFDADKKAKRNKEIFPQDCKKAFDMGARMVK